MRRVLMIAFHFPPLAGSSGVQRTLRFAQHLPQFGWQPLVLSATPCAYERTSADLAGEVPKSTVVRRAFALDAARHLSLGGRYIAAFARPDRWVSWRFDAVRVGLRMIRQFAPQIIWSTYPIATAHLIGAALQRRTGLPWVADFRDPMAQEGYPADARAWQSFKRIEENVIAQASRCMFTTPGAAREYRERYPTAAHRIKVLENGYDEDSFVAAELRVGSARQPLNAGMVTLLHSGIVYPDERDPTRLFTALARMKHGASLGSRKLKIRFRASQHDAMLHAMARANDVVDLIETLPPVGYGAALDEMLRADALLLIQAANCNEQIPAKLYEYFRAGRPLVCLSDPAGDTAGALRRAGISALARLDSVDEIVSILNRLLAGDLKAQVPNNAVVASASRLGRTQEIALHFDRLVGEMQPPECADAPAPVRAHELPLVGVESLDHSR